MSSIGAVLSHFENVKSCGDGKWSARCPAHEDRQNSLSIGTGSDGTVLLKCHAQCQTSDVLAKAGLAISDLFARANTSNGKPVIDSTYDYRDEHGELLMQVVRYRPKGFRQRKPKPDGGWDWSVKGVRVVPFRLPELLADPSAPVAICEGEKDVLSLERISFVATCNAGGAGKWKSDHAQYLRGRRVVILPDNDDAGRKHAEQVARSLQAASSAIRVVELPGLPEKGDVSDWINAGGTREQLQAIIDATPEWEPQGPDQPDFVEQPAMQSQRPSVKLITADELIDNNPSLRPPLIHGLARRGETVNLISASKIGKSWLSYHLGFCICTGRRFLDTFECEAGKVLHIDNELHEATLAFRVWTVANAMGIQRSQYGSDLVLVPARGKNLTLYDIEPLLEQFGPGEISAVILDAWYRCYPPGVNENDNPQITGLYNLIDRMAARLDCCWVNIHHSSKGSQGDKAVTDVGAGAGAQSRAADCHIVLRPHEEENSVVFEAAVRSFAPVQPLPLRWNFPLWQPADDLDPEKLKGRLNGREQKQGARDTADIDKLTEALRESPATVRVLRGKTGIGRERCNVLLDRLESVGRVRWSEVTIKNNLCRQYELSNHAPEATKNDPISNGFIDF